MATSTPRTDRMAPIAIALLLALGCTATGTREGDASAIRTRWQELPEAPAGAPKYEVTVMPFAVSPLVSLPSGTRLSREELATLARAQVIGQLSNSQQITPIPVDGNAATDGSRFVLRGEITRVLAAPTIAGTDASGATSQREMDVRLQLSLSEVAPAATRPVCFSSGGARKRVFVTYPRARATAQPVDASLPQNPPELDDEWTIDQQHLQDLMETAANDVVVKLLHVANDRLYSLPPLPRSEEPTRFSAH